jgi:[ribosomal protein S5]-alanine N-acetyltransferase
MKKLGPFVTDRLTAFPLRDEDAQTLCLMHRDLGVMKTLGGVRSEEETKRWLYANLDHWNLHGFGLWMFRQRTDEAFVGRCGLRRVQLAIGNEVELAYALMTQYWSKGLATEMAKAVIAIGFEQLELGNLIALVDAENAASRRLAERLDFHFEQKTAWKSLPTMLYRLDRSQWTKPGACCPTPD